MFEIPHAFYLHSGKYNICESGVLKFGPLPFHSDDVFAITRRGSRVQYYIKKYGIGDYINVYNSLVPMSTATFFADSSLYFGNDRII